ncbi:MAG: DUF4870 domain-containing protein [Ginsengibacter sp.]
MEQEKKAEAGISERLKNYRRISCLSQEGLAESSGISIRTIQRIEEGKSLGSGYTLTALAKALNINATDLTIQETENTLTTYDNENKLKILNLSAISVILFPLSNVILPTLIFLKNRDNKKVNVLGRKIISFQILWSLGTLLLTLILPIILLLLFQSLRGSRIPLFVPVYILSVIVNVYFIIRFAICINNHSPFLERLPTIF